MHTSPKPFEKCSTEYTDSKFQRSIKRMDKIHNTISSLNREVIKTKVQQTVHFEDMNAIESIINEETIKMNKKIQQFKTIIRVLAEKIKINRIEADKKSQKRRILIDEMDQKVHQFLKRSAQERIYSQNHLIYILQENFKELDKILEKQIIITETMPEQLKNGINSKHYHLKQQIKQTNEQKIANTQTIKQKIFKKLALLKGSILNHRKSMEVKEQKLKLFLQQVSNNIRETIQQQTFTRQTNKQDLLTYFQQKFVREESS